MGRWCGTWCSVSFDALLSCCAGSLWHVNGFIRIDMQELWTLMRRIGPQNEAVVSFRCQVSILCRCLHASPCDLSQCQSAFGAFVFCLSDWSLHMVLASCPFVL